VSRFAFILLLAATCAAAEWTLGITSFNNPNRLTIEAEPGTALRLTSGTRRIVLNHGSTAGLLAIGNQIDIFAQRATSTGYSVRITAMHGGPAKFSIRNGVQRRRYTGVLDVSAIGGVLRAICRVPSDIAPPSDKPRHRGYDFCDQAHCGSSSDERRR
jgi:hypothetical protein